jgi:hypothetical protein
MIPERTCGVLQKHMQIAKEEVPDPLPQVKKPVLSGLANKESFYWPNMITPKMPLP